MVPPMWGIGRHVATTPNKWRVAYYPQDAIAAVGRNGDNCVGAVKGLTKRRIVHPSVDQPK